MIDPSISMAVAVQSHKGIYALLLGSGASRAAGIPTGWEVITDIINRLATAQGEDAGDAPDEWFRNKYGKGPSYGELLQLLAPKPAERTMLLQGYFEPTEEEREKGSKLPTAAHKAIARLMAAGHIRVIVTTNFDRLIERALEEEGISPTVVSNADQVDGMMPLPHVQCLVVKVHGDYLDMRLCNTPEELAQYPKTLNDLLDRIFSDYGLIVCGWSAEWDQALRECIIRNTRFRFSTYWLARGALSGAANDLVQRRQGIVVPIQDADNAFTSLAARVEAIDQQRLTDPASPRIAVATAKRYLSSDQHRIDFHDLVMRELKEVRCKTDLKVMPLDSPLDEQSYPHRVDQMTSACFVLAPVVATGVMWDDGGRDDLWKRCINLLARSDFRSGVSIRGWEGLQYLPATIIAYSACVGAVIKKRYGIFKTVFVDANATAARGIAGPAIEWLGICRMVGGDMAQRLLNTEDRKKTPGSDWMVKTLESMLADVLPPDVQFEDLWDEIEFIASLISADETGWAMRGRFMWRKEGRFSDQSLVKRTDKELQQLGDQHPLLAVGLFGGQPDRLQKALTHVAKIAQQVSF